MADLSSSRNISGDMYFADARTHTRYLGLDTKGSVRFTARVMVIREENRRHGYHLKWPSEKSMGPGKKGRAENVAGTLDFPLSRYRRENVTLDAPVIDAKAVLNREFNF